MPTPPPTSAEHVLGRHLAVLEHELAGVGAAHAELVELLRGRESLEALLDQEGGDAARAGVRIGLGIDHERLGLRSVGDPHLAAVEDVSVALLLGAGLHRDDVGAGAGLGHRERADVLAGDQLGQIFAFLRVVAVPADLIDAQVRMRPVGEADRAGRARDLLHRDAMLEIAEPGAAPLLLDRDPVHAELAELRPQIARERVGTVDLVGARRDLVGREAAHAVAQHVGGLAQAEIEAAQVVPQHERWSLALAMLLVRGLSCNRGSVTPAHPRRGRNTT